MTDRTLVVWRDSVHAGDDADAPHAWLITVDADATVFDIVSQITTARYLASISTGEATWIVDGDRPLAVVAQQWAAPRFLVDACVPVRSVIRTAGQPDVHVRHWNQVSPDRVYDALRAGEPLPDRYSR